MSTQRSGRPHSTRAMPDVPRVDVMRAFYGDRDNPNTYGTATRTSVGSVGQSQMTGVLFCLWATPTFLFVYRFHWANIVCADSWLGHRL